MRIALVSLLEDITSPSLRVISSYIKKCGHSTSMIFIPSQLNDTNLSRLRHLIEELETEVVGISVMTDYFHKAKLITQELKDNLEVTIIWGGPHPTICPEESLNFADMVCIGEGEEALLELLNKMDKKQDYYKTKNIWFKKEGKVIKNDLRNLAEDLDRYPFPDYDIGSQYILTREGFQKLTGLTLKEKIAGRYVILTSRGCPFSCDYCYNSYLRNIYRDKYKSYIRWRSIDHVIGELKYAQNSLGPLSRICILDDIFLARNSSEIKEFAKQYSKEINLPFYALANPNLITEEKIRILGNCGLDTMQVGIQTGSEKIAQNVYSRNVSNSKILQATNILRKYRVSRICDIILNNPYESKDDIIKTIELLLKIPKPFKLQGYGLIFFPGTALFERAQKDNYISVSYNNIDERATIFSPMNTVFQNYNRVITSNRLYRPNFSTEDKEYLNFLLSMTPWINQLLIKYFTQNENLLTRWIVGQIYPRMMRSLELVAKVSRMLSYRTIKRALLNPRRTILKLKDILYYKSTLF